MLKSNAYTFSFNLVHNSQQSVKCKLALNFYDSEQIVFQNGYAENSLYREIHNSSKERFVDTTIKGLRKPDSKFTHSKLQFEGFMNHIISKIHRICVLYVLCET